MKRKIYDSLLAWKAHDSTRVALLIDGARRVGKSYIVEEFAKNEYKSYILIDFNKANPDIRRLFFAERREMTWNGAGQKNRRPPQAARSLTDHRSGRMRATTCPMVPGPGSESIIT